MKDRCEVVEKQECHGVQGSLYQECAAARTSCDPEVTVTPSDAGWSPKARAQQGLLVGGDLECRLRCSGTLGVTVKGGLREGRWRVDAGGGG